MLIKNSVKLNLIRLFIKQSNHQLSSNKLNSNQLSSNKLNSNQLNSNKLNSFQLNSYQFKNYCQESTYFERNLKRQSIKENTDHDAIDQLLKTNQFKKLYDSHQNLNTFQTVLLAIGSSIGALIDPYRDDLVAISSETFIGQSALKKLYEKMRSDEEANRILIDRPRINSIEIGLDELSKLPVNTLGYQYVKFLNDNNITCDSRKPVKYVDNANLAYVLQRYREVHDFTHLLFNMRTTILGEVVIKWIEAIQTEIPMCIGAAVLGPIKLYPKQRDLFRKYYLDWAIQNGKQSKPTFLVYFEERWEQDIDDLRKEMNILPLPKIN